MLEKKILVIIPARSGSKGIKNKNIISFRKKPMLVWSIEHALQSKFIKNMKIIVSTDSTEYKKIAENHGAEVPFLRPKEISGDCSTDYECFRHCHDWLQQHQNYTADIILHLRPTQPCRSVEALDECISLFLENYEKYDSLRSVIPQKKSPCKMYFINDENTLKPIIKKWEDIDEPYNQGRQFLPTFYLHNGYVDILKVSLLSKGTISGDKIFPYVMKETDNIDIDEIKDLEKIM